MSMRPTFYGLEISRTGLTVSQKGLDVTGHNIANVDTAGYTRQRLVNTAYEPYNAVTQWKPVDLALVGSGAHVKILDQIRDKFLDRQFRTEQTLYTYWSTRTQGLSYVESLFEGSDDADIEAGINALFKSFIHGEEEASDREQRKVIQQNAINLCQNFNLVYERLMDQQSSQNLAVKTVTDQINTIADNIAILNKSIYSFEIDGLMANDLRDKRNLLIDELAQLVDIEYQETSQDYMVIKVGGVELVNHVNTKRLTTRAEDNPIEGGEPLYIPMWEDNKDLNLGALTGGKLKAHIDLRDNSTAETPGIPYFMQQLNNLARALVEKVNEVHQGGWTHSAGGASQTGVLFFDVPGGNIRAVTAGNIRVSQDILNSEYNIALSDEFMNLDTANPDDVKPGNQKNAQKLYALLGMTELRSSLGVSIGSFEGYLGGIVLDVAVTLNHSKKMVSTTTIQLLDADNQRTSISGVSLDEEMTNLLKYQHAYAGSSRVITTMDEALDVLINKMGLVGR